MNQLPFLFCQYADDFRQEINGKTSYIGVYNGNLIANGEAPFSLPKLITIATLFLPRDIFVSSLELSMSWNDEPPIRHVAITPDKVRDQLSGIREESQGIYCQAVFELKPFTFDQTGRLRVFANLNGDILESNALKFDIQAKFSESPQDVQPSL